MSEDTEKAEQIQQFFKGMSKGLTEGLKAAAFRKMQEYVRRHLNGEPREQIIQGQPQSWREELERRFTIASAIEDEDETWNKVNESFPSRDPSNREAFGYARRYLRGEPWEEITAGLAEDYKNRIRDYIRATARVVLAGPESEK